LSRLTTSMTFSQSAAGMEWDTSPRFWGRGMARTFQARNDAEAN
jgi:hypothetical protein